MAGSPCKADVQQQTAQGFTAKSGDLCGYEGGRRGPSHPETADPGSASGDIELSTTQGGTTNKVAKANSYGSFGLGVELGTWRKEREH